MAGEFFSLMSEDPSSMARIAVGIEKAVLESFRIDATRDGKICATSNEMKRRGAICVELVRILRGELSWSVARIVDELPKALRARLDGLPWDPANARTFWTPTEA